MKRSLRLPFILLLLIATCTALSCRAALRRGLFGGSSPETAAAVAVPSFNATLLRLSASEAAEAELRRDVDDLLDGTFFPSGRRRRRSYSSWRRENHQLEDRTRHRSRLRSPKDYRVLPEFRRHLQYWFRRRRFHPGIMAELLDQVKRPLDLHAGAAGHAPRRRYASCAVVGNSGILLNSDRGDLIDSHDFVIRLNNARVHGYERNVGSKTNISFVNSNILHICARRGSCFCHPYGEAVPLVMYICQAVHFLDYTVCSPNHKAPLLVTDFRFDMLCSRIVKYYSLRRFVEETGKLPEEWATTHSEKLFHYSSGMQAVMLALGICDQVSAFGFGKSPAAKHHYHTNQKAELNVHDYEAEYALYRDLAERPQVIPFLGDSGFKVPPFTLYH